MVSIHTRHFWRVNLGRVIVRRFMYGFQSTPAISGGRILHADHQGRAGAEVSIHTRHFWRVNLDEGREKELNILLFQSTPAISGG